MYTKNQIRELRDAVIKEKDSDQYVYAPEGATARYVCETVMYESEPEKIEQKIKSFADFARVNECDAIHCHDPKAINYQLAYDILFGDISVAPLHINDALETVAKWRLKQPA
jgi:hypothetical protein